VVGLVLGLSITIAAVMGPAAGDLSKLGPDDLRALVSPALTQPIEEGITEITPRHAHVTTYTTKAGKSLLVIAGEALNNGGQDLGDIEAVASVLDANGVVDRRQALVGVELNADALVSVASAQDLEAAYAGAEKSAGAPALKPGSTLPFMVVFPDVPSDLERRTFQVEFRRANRAPSARTP
jgi:hypothetical protein